jgi:hypothetical protein
MVQILRSENYAEQELIFKSHADEVISSYSKSEFDEDTATAGDISNRRYIERLQVHSISIPPLTVT